MQEKEKFSAFFYKKIWSCQKKAVPLRDFSCKYAKYPRI